VLHFLAVEDHQEAVAWLHARGADIDTKNEFGTPVLFEVASLGYKKLFGWLIEAGADAHARDADGQDLIEYLLDYDKDEMAGWVRTRVVGI
jgi:ankyrin repeat protein